MEKLRLYGKAKAFNRKALYWSELTTVIKSYHERYVELASPSTIRHSGLNLMKKFRRYIKEVASEKCRFLRKLRPITLRRLSFLQLNSEVSNDKTANICGKFLLHLIQNDTKIEQYSVATLAFPLDPRLRFEILSILIQL